MVKKIILFGTASLFCVMFIAYSCNNNQKPVIDTGGGGTTLIVTPSPFVTDPSLPPPALDATLPAWDGSTTVEPALVNDVYEVENANELAWIAAQTANDFTGKTIRLMENINMNNQAFDGIASLAGTLDGNSKIIHKINISKPSVNNVGLVSTLKTGGVIKDLTISEGTVSGNASVGGVVGANSGDSTMISNVANYDVTVTGTSSYIGGIIGYNSNNIIIVSVVNSGDVIGPSFVGGIIGLSYKYNATLNVNITKVRNSGNISSGIYIGGIVGASNGATIEDAGNSGNISGTASIAGIIGVIFYSPTTIDDSYNYVEVTISGSGNNAGSIVGSVYNSGANLDINSSYYLTTTYNAVGPNTAGSTVVDNSTEITLAEFNTQSTFTGWDFSNTWSMGTLHPILK